MSLDVLPPGKAQDDDGQIYNRRYEVQTKELATIMDTDDTPDPAHNEIWIDKASMSASIMAESNKDEWRKLVFDGELIDPAVPERMRDDVLKLKDKVLRLDGNYFELTLRQLETFLTMIRNELKQSLDTLEIADLCDFEYAMKGVKFKNHDSAKGNWADAELGLFGWNRDGETYSTCLDNFNNHLLDEFKGDWRTIEPGVVD